MASSQEQWKSLLASGLEALFHNLLFVRRVYSKGSFSPSSFCGIRCKANRHPDVVRYILQVIVTIVPCIISGTAENVYFCVMKDPVTVVETFTLHLGGAANIVNSDSSLTQELSRLERAMRNLVLSTLALDGLRLTKLTDSASFQIAIEMPNEERKLSPELSRAVAHGAWYEAATSRIESGQMVQAIHEANVGPLTISLISS